jgi:ABC-2 type transport system ATP-binding protein
VLTAGPIIDITGVRKSFGRTKALDGLSMQVAEGKVSALLGPNGAGKTTLVRILATLLTPDGGRATVAGIDVTRRPVAVRRVIGLAGQHAAVDATLTGRENLVMVARLYRLSAAQARQRSAEVLERLSLTEAADRPVRTYSGGMRRRLDVGASLVGRPAILLLDEPSTGLDPAARLELWSFLRGLVAQGTTILLTTQQLEEADRLADAITIIDRGTLVTEGTPAQLKAGLGYETIEVTLADPARLPHAVQVLEPLAEESPGTDGPAARISFRAPRGARALPATVRLLDQAGIAVEDVTARRPSLDDVFVSVLGRANGAGAADARPA